MKPSNIEIMLNVKDVMQVIRSQYVVSTLLTTLFHLVEPYLSRSKDSKVICASISQLDDGLIEGRRTGIRFRSLWNESGEQEANKCSHLLYFAIGLHLFA